MEEIQVAIGKFAVCQISAVIADWCDSGPRGAVCAYSQWGGENCELCELCKCPKLGERADMATIGPRWVTRRSQRGQYQWVASPVAVVLYLSDLLELSMPSNSVPALGRFQVPSSIG